MMLVASATVRCLARKDLCRHSSQVTSTVIVRTRFVRSMVLPFLCWSASAAA